MSSAIETQSPCQTPSREDVDWDFWMDFDAVAAPNPQLKKFAENIRPQLVLRTMTWQSGNQNPGLLSPPFLVSNTPTNNSFRPYGIPSPSIDEPSDECYFAIGNRLTPQTSLSESSYSRSSQESRSATVYDYPVHPSSEPDITSKSNQSYSPSSTQSVAPDISDRSRKSLEPQRSVATKKRKVSMDDPVHVARFAGQAVMMQFGKLDRGRRAMPPERKIGYRDTRSKGSCPRCKAHKKRCNRSCDPYIECLVTRPLNFLDTPVNAKLFRSRPDAAHPLFSAKAEIYDLKDLSPQSHPVTVSLSQRFGLRSQSFGLLDVQVCKFDAHRDLKTAYVYSTSTGRHRIELPRFCLNSSEETRVSLESYINATWCGYLRDIIRHSDQITQYVLLEAQRHAINSSSRPNCLVRRALMLLAVNRMIELSWTLSGSETLGIPLLPHVDTPGHNQRPITPVMDTQLDQIIIQTFLVPLRQTLLHDLQSKMHQGKKEDWFEIFLTVFILITNTGLLLKHSRKNAMICGAPRRYNSIALAKEYFHGSNILLAHFHHSFYGAAKLLYDNNQPTRSELMDYQRQFLDSIIPVVHAQREEMFALREAKQYEVSLYWTHQMFFDGWVPESREVRWL